MGAVESLNPSGPEIKHAPARRWPELTARADRQIGSWLRISSFSAMVAGAGWTPS
jgi:hypothetical protein